MIKCKGCKFWEINNNKGWGRLGECSSPKFKIGYRYNREEIADDEVEIENDEGWGCLTGPLFGCIHGELKQ